MSLVNLHDEDMYVLTDGSAWIDVKKFAIRIHSTDEGVVVDVFDAAALEEDPFCEPLGSTYAFDADCGNKEEETP
ncbi:MAG TPA: hypothetical protein PLQ71_15905 [Nitrospira sp.]|nr:hypothetical protein [Nitrospira sp.]